MGIFSWWFGPPSPAAFAAKVQRTFRSIDPSRTFEFDAEQFRLVSTDGMVINLANLYLEHVEFSWWKRRGHLRRIGTVLETSITELPSDFEVAKARIRPRLSHRQAELLTRLSAESSAPAEYDPIGRPIGEHLILTLVYDLPASVLYLTRGQLEEWGVSEYEAFEVALENLRQPVPLAALKEEKEAAPFAYSPQGGDNYDATRLVNVEKIRQLEVEGEVIALVPNRDTLFITGSESERGIDMLRHFAEQSMNEPRPLLPTPLRLVGDDWEDWLPPADHPAYESFRRLDRRFRAGLYAESTEAYQQTFIDREEGVFVAPVIRFSDNDEPDRVMSGCTWTEGIVSLLPETDVIGFMRENAAEPLMVPWDEAMNIVGGLLEADDSFYPVRHRTRGFPSPAQWQGLSAARYQ
jgi:hypothetical protein